MRRRTTEGQNMCAAFDTRNADNSQSVSRTEEIERDSLIRWKSCYTVGSLRGIVTIRFFLPAARYAGQWIILQMRRLVGRVYLGPLNDNNMQSFCKIIVHWYVPVSQNIICRRSMSQASTFFSSFVRCISFIFIFPDIHFERFASNSRNCECDQWGRFGVRSTRPCRRSPLRYLLEWQERLSFFWLSQKCFFVPTF